MQINLTNLAIEPTERIAPSIRQWTVGQLLDANVIGRNGPKTVSLTIDGTSLRASTSLNLNPGDKLQLRVSQLHPVALLTPVRSEKIAQAEQIRQALAKALPKQGSIVDLLKTLKVLTTNSTSSTTEMNRQLERPLSGQANVPSNYKLPTPVAEVARHILSLVPPAETLRDPFQLRSAVTRSGLFSEAVARNSLFPNSTDLPELDLKWQLRRLLHELLNPPTAVARRASSASAPRQTSNDIPANQNGVRSAMRNERVIDPGNERDLGNSLRSSPLKNLVGLVDGAIAKIETNQLSVLNSRLDGEHYLSLELPIVLNQTFKVIPLQINQQHSQSDGEQCPTTMIVIEVPLEDERILRAMVSHTNDRISIRMWSEDPELLGTVIDNVGALATNLTDKGLENVGISISEIRPIEHFAKRPEILVDERA